MQRSCHKRKLWMLLGAAALGVLVWKTRALVWLAARHLFLGWLAAMAALPVMKKVEKHMSAGLAAALSVLALNAVWAAVLFLLLPALLRHGRMLAEMLPELWKSMENLSGSIQTWLASHGIVNVDVEMQSALLARAQDAIGASVPAVLGRLKGFAGGLGQWLLAPVFGFYFLRDRHAISACLKKCLPENWREPAVCVLREMRKETTGYLRGQLMVSGVVSALTAIGLLLCGVPSWFALGIWMGILELIPYVGPIAGVLMTILFALPLGLWRVLWALGVVLLVQQLEGSLITPKVISQATRLHPAVVILCVVVGGAAVGIAGVLLFVPLVLCLRAAWRVLVLREVAKS